MQKIMIPSRFKIFGQTIRVVFNPEHFTETSGGFGFASYRTNTISLCPSTSVLPISDEQIGETFWHELTHFLLYYAEAAYSEKTEYMHQDEGFVGLLGSLLHQAVSTFEYDTEKR